MYLKSLFTQTQHIRGFGFFTCWGVEDSLATTPSVVTTKSVGWFAPET